MSSHSEPHSLNDSEGFYVEVDCCTACDLPFSEAPELFAYDEEMHCYVTRQPENETELEKAILLTWRAELQCIRYGGNSKETIRRISELGNPHLCDSQTAAVKPVFRNHVTFECLKDANSSAEKFAIELRRFLVENASDHLEYKFKPLSITSECVALHYSWYEDNFHTINFATSKNSNMWHIFQSAEEKLGSRSAFMTVDEWLKNDSRFHNLRWYSESNWQKSTGWQKKLW